MLVGISSIKAHDLVADLLLYHPDNALALAHNDGWDLALFIETFKKVNQCGRSAVDGREIYRQCFPEDRAFLETRSLAALANAREKGEDSPIQPPQLDKQTLECKRSLTHFHLHHTSCVTH
jgi:hypothetical protein